MASSALAPAGTSTAVPSTVKATNPGGAATAIASQKSCHPERSEEPRCERPYRTRPSLLGPSSPSAPQDDSVWLRRLELGQGHLGPHVVVHRAHLQPDLYVLPGQVDHGAGQ